MNVYIFVHDKMLKKNQNLSFLIITSEFISVFRRNSSNTEEILKQVQDDKV